MLPDELIHYIIVLACTLPPPETPYAKFLRHRRRKQSVLPHLDVQTTLKLCYLSSQHHAILASLLYRSPRIPNPVTLALFARALTLRPALGRLVKHLWVGHTYVGESLPINALNFGLGGYSAGYSLNLLPVRQSPGLHPSLPPEHILTPSFELRAAELASFHCRSHNCASTSYTPVDPDYLLRGILIDVPGTGDRDTSGSWRWIGVDEWVMRLWDGRELITELRWIAKREWYRERRRLRVAAAQRGTKLSAAGVKPHPDARDRVHDHAFRPRHPQDRRPCTQNDPIDFGDSDRYVTNPLPPSAASSQHEAPAAPASQASRPTAEPRELYNEESDGELIEFERMACVDDFKERACSLLDTNLVTIENENENGGGYSTMKIGKHRIEEWYLYLIAGAQARGKIAARRAWIIEHGGGGGGTSSSTGNNNSGSSSNSSNSIGSGGHNNNNNTFHDHGRSRDSNSHPSLSSSGRSTPSSVPLGQQSMAALSEEQEDLLMLQDQYLKEPNPKNHFGHPTIYARSGATYLLIGGEPPGDDLNLRSDARSDFGIGEDSDSDLSFNSTDSEDDYLSDEEAGAAREEGPVGGGGGAGDSNIIMQSGQEVEQEQERRRRQSALEEQERRARNAELRREEKQRGKLPYVTELERERHEDQADLWGGEHNFSSNGNERAGVSNSFSATSRRGMSYGCSSSVLRSCLLQGDDGYRESPKETELRESWEKRKRDENLMLSSITLGSILAQLKTVLTMAPKLETLALDGFLERAVCGRRAAGGMGKLRCVSLGPPPPYWSSPLLFAHAASSSTRQVRRDMLRERERERERMEEEEAEEIMHQGNPPIQVVAPREHNDNGDGRDHVDHQIPPHAPILLRALLNPSPTFSMLRTLHISGCMLFPSEARAVAGEGGQLPNLRNFRWTLWQPHSEAHPVGVVETLGTILGTYAFGSNLGGRTTMSTSLISNSSSSAPVASRQRKRKLRHVHAILHPLDQSLFYRKAPEFLIKDKRLRIDTCRSDQVDNNLIEMVRWWEFESGIVGVDEGSYSTDSFNVWMNRRMMGANGGMATINTPAIPMGNALAQAQAQGLVQAQVQGQIVNTFQHHHQQQRGAQGAAAAAPGGRNLGGNGHLDP